MALNTTSSSKEEDVKNMVLKGNLLLPIIEEVDVDVQYENIGIYSLNHEIL